MCSQECMRVKTVRLIVVHLMSTQTVRSNTAEASRPHTNNCSSHLCATHELLQLCLSKGTRHALEQSTSNFRHNNQKGGTASHSPDPHTFMLYSRCLCLLLYLCRVTATAYIVILFFHQLAESPKYTFSCERELSSCYYLLNLMHLYTHLQPPQLWAVGSNCTAQPISHAS